MAGADRNPDPGGHRPPPRARAAAQPPGRSGHDQPGGPATAATSGTSGHRHRQLGDAWAELHVAADQGRYLKFIVTGLVALQLPAPLAVTWMVIAASTAVLREPFRRAAVVIEQERL